MTSRVLVVACVAAALAAAGSAQSGDARAPGAATVTLARRPANGERLVHALVLDHTLVSQRFATRTNGEEQVSQDELEVGGRTTLRMADEVRALAGARPTLVRRVYEDSTVHVDMRVTPPGGKPRALALDGGSPLAGASVLFRWIPARDEWGRIYDGLETSEEFLPRLAPAIDLAGLLPPGPVAVGARWTIDAAGMRSVFDYGGQIPVRFAKGADPLLARTTALGVGGPLHEVVAGELTGAIEAELAAVDAGVARIVLKADVRAARDQTALNQSKLTPPELYDGRVVESALVEWTFRGEGELTWLVDAGRAQRLALSGAETVRLKLALKDVHGSSGSDLSLAGGLKLSIDVSAGAAPAPR